MVLAAVTSSASRGQASGPFFLLAGGGEGGSGDGDGEGGESGGEGGDGVR